MKTAAHISLSGDRPSRWGGITGNIADQADLNTILDSFADDLNDLTGEVETQASAAAVVQALSTKADLVDGVIPASQLPSYVDDVLIYPTWADFPVTGEAGKIYVTEDTNKTYRWSGSGYVVIADGVALGETATTAYRGDRGKAAYDHTLSQGNPHNATTSDIPEGNKLYFTEDRVLQAALIGLNTTNPAPVTATDALLAAIGKLQAQINNSGGGSSVTWVSAASIGTTHPSFVNVQFAKIGGLLWIRGYCNNIASINAGTTLFLLTNPSYHLDIPNTTVFPSTLGEIKTFTIDPAVSKLIQLRNVVNNANKFSLHNSANYTPNEYNQIQPVALGRLLTP